ncbi:hypothetical protein EJ04DRAFT_575038 [Polyplosphaeria fusca]|uniref:Uncharacterized protein n=1 Tax=Polyplosphaeria fusca TaxID=682080 RepID=A0A9P4V4W4_9PLEO|nr:hypothetical protein EJ04DRAFT_575038 [Polyplosphaeria fusca]
MASNSSSLVNRMVGSIANNVHLPLQAAYHKLHTAQNPIPSPPGWEEVAPIIKSVVGYTILGAGLLGAASYTYRTKLAPTDDEKVERKLVSFLLEKSAQKDQSLRAKIKDFKQKAEEARELLMHNETRSRMGTTRGRKFSALSRTLPPSPEDETGMEPNTNWKNEQLQHFLKVASLSQPSSSPETPCPTAPYQRPPWQRRAKVFRAPKSSPSSDLDLQGLEKASDALVSSALSSPDVVARIQRNIDKIKYSGDGTTPSAKQREKASAQRTPSPLGFNKSKGKRKAEELEVLQSIEETGETNEMEILSSIEEYEEVSELIDTPEAQKMDLQWREKQRLQSYQRKKLRLTNISLSPLESASPTKRRQGSDISEIERTPARQAASVTPSQTRWSARIAARKSEAVAKSTSSPSTIRSSIKTKSSARTKTYAKSRTSSTPATLKKRY